MMDKRSRWLVGVAAFSVVVLFLGFAELNGKLGFPLDDAWIHQTYARNLIRNGRWEYTPGMVSSGSTAPLWTLLLAIGYLLHLPYLLWTYLLGGLSLFFLALAGMRLWSLMWPEWKSSSWLVGLTIAFTWPLVWAAVSGMETLLFAAIGMWILALYTDHQSNAPEEEIKEQRSGGPGTTMSQGGLATLGILSGLLVLVRPDGVVLLLLIAIGLNLRRLTFRERFRSTIVYVGAMILPLAPYLGFNLWASGNIWPNTFYAKQAEYAALLAQPLVSRLTRLLFYSLGGPETGWKGSSGAHLFLLPGVVVSVYLAIRADMAGRRVHRLMPLLWAGGHVLLYAWRLPVTYQHGRYLFAAMPVWVLYGLAGWQWLANLLGNGRLARLGKLIGKLSFGVLVLVFLVIGAQAYGTDVAFIEGEMVNVARWLSQNTPDDALVASHDIGAIGYFAGRPLLDLAGLITPEIIPWLIDEEALDRYILSSNADYLVTAPGWPYAAVVASDEATFTYSTGFKWTQEQGINNMSVYRLRP